MELFKYVRSYDKNSGCVASLRPTNAMIHLASAVRGCDLQASPSVAQEMIKYHLTGRIRSILFGDNHFGAICHESMTASHVKIVDNSWALVWEFVNKEKANDPYYKSAINHWAMHMRDALEISRDEAIWGGKDNVDTLFTILKRTEHGPYVPYVY